MFSTIHITSTSIRLMTVKNNKLHKWIVSPLEPGLVRDGKIIDVKRVADIIGNQIKSVSAPKSNVIFTISGLPYTYRTMEFPKMNPEQIEQAMNFNLSSEFTVPLENLYVSWAPINIKPDSVEYYIIAVDRQFVDTIIDIANIIGITDWSLDIRLLALARAAAQANAVVVSLDYDYMEMVLVQDGKIKDMHSVNVDMDIDDFHRQNYFSTFTSELSRLISYHYSRQSGDYPNSAQPIVITGEVLTDSLETAGAEGLLEELRNTTGHPVRYIEITLPHPPFFSFMTYSTNIGLALRKLKKKSRPNNGYYDIKLDLLRGVYDKKPQTLSYRYVILPVVLALIVGAVIPVINAREQVKAEVADLESRLGIATRNLAHARSVEAEVLKIQNEIDAITTRLETSRSERQQLLNSKGTYASHLSRVTSAFPGQTDFENITINSESIKINGVTDDPFNVIDYVRYLEKAGYDNLNIQSIGDPNDEKVYPFSVMINKP